MVQKSNASIDLWTKNSWKLVDAVGKIVNIECNGRVGRFPFPQLSTPRVRALYTMYKEFDETIRELPLSFEYFELVVGRKDAKSLLKAAVMNEWSVNDLRGRVAEDKHSSSPMAFLRTDFNLNDKLRFESYGKTNYVTLLKSKNSKDVLAKAGSVVLNRSEVGLVYRTMGTLSKS